MSQATELGEINVVNSRFMLKVFYAFVAMALLSVGLSAGGKWLGASISMAGHTDDPSSREIVIGNNVIVAPANAIRFERQRVNGITSRLDLYFHWPDMQGYRVETRGDFNHADDRKRLLFLSFEHRMMSRDMSGRFEPIYRSLIETQPKHMPNGLRSYDFAEKSGYLNEMLAVADRNGAEPYVARCLTGTSAAESFAPCERDIQLGDDLSLTYRFPAELLPEWKQLDETVSARAAQMLKR